MTPIRLDIGTLLELDGIVYSVEQRLGSEIELRDASGKASYVTDATLQQAWSESRLVFQPRTHRGRILSSGQTNVTAITLPESEQHKMIRYWQFGKAMFEASQAAKLNARTRQEIAVEVSRMNGWVEPVPSAATLYRIARMWIGSNGAALAHAPRHAAKGNRKPRLPTRVEEIMGEVIPFRLMTPQRLTMADIHEAVRAEIARYNERVTAAEKLPLPSYSAIRHRIRTMDQYRVVKARLGENVARRRHGIFGPGHEATRVNEVWQIDHTPLNILLVDTDIGVIIGQPYITAAIDHYSRCVVGFYITFEPPSFLSVARCLEQAIAPKDYLPAQHPAIVNAWPCHGVPERILVDNGREFHSQALTTACALLNIHIDYAGRKAPWTKGIIERMMKVVNHSFTHKISGTTFSHFLDRGDYDASKFAVVPYDLFVKAFHKQVVDVLLREVHRGIRDIPVLRWTENVQEWPVLLPPKRDDLKFLLSKHVGSREVQHYGIDFLGLRYSSDDLTRIRRLPKDLHTADVSYDPSDIGWIYVTHPAIEDRLRIPCTAFRYASGLGEWSHKIIKRYTAEKLGKQIDDKELLAAKVQIATMLEEAFATKSLKHKKKMARMLGTGTAQLHGIEPAAPPAAAGPPLIEHQPQPQPPADDDLDVSDMTASLGMPTRENKD